MIGKILKKYVDAIIFYTDYEQEDTIYLVNSILSLIGEYDVDNMVLQDESTFEERHITDCYQLVLQLVERACSNGVVQTQLQQEQLACQLLNFITPMPSALQKRFNQFSNKIDATDYFYALSQRNNYIKTIEIAKNIQFDYIGKYGKLAITINLSKPEKDPKEIASKVNVVSTNYPKCLLCKEQVGFIGHSTNPPRVNHRIIHIELDNKKWGFQYSPYAYYNEHCIVFSHAHEPMKITRATFKNLLSLVSQFPHYFFGSNADLPIVGGSILTHDHYQGGRYVFPMDNAEVLDTFKLDEFQSVKGQLLKWPLSVVRLVSSNINQLVDMAEYILNQWRQYHNEQLNIIAYTNEVSHHTITPIARFRNGQYELDLVLRDNNVSEQYPDGVFHPHPDVQHIKKENIGLIEVMGLAILPPRLKRELEEIKQYLLGDTSVRIATYHQDWVNELSKLEFDSHTIDQLLHEAVGKKFERVLEDAGVFKQTTEGLEQFKNFIATL